MTNVQKDVGAMVYNYFYNGWAYRVETEGHTAVQHDAQEAEERVMKELKDEIRKEILAEQSKARQEKLNDTPEAIQP